MPVHSLPGMKIKLIIAATILQLRKKVKQEFGLEETQNEIIID